MDDDDDDGGSCLDDDDDGLLMDYECAMETEDTSDADDKPVVGDEIHSSRSSGIPTTGTVASSAGRIPSMHYSQSLVEIADPASMFSFARSDSSNAHTWVLNTRDVHLVCFHQQSHHLVLVLLHQTCLFQDVHLII